MKTFVVEDILRDYTPGLIVVKAKNKKEALMLIASDQQLSYHDFTDDCFHVDCLADKIRELKDNEVVYVHGGG